MGDLLYFAFGAVLSALVSGYYAWRSSRELREEAGMLRAEAEKLREQNVLMLRSLRRETPLARRPPKDDDSSAGLGDSQARSPRAEEEDRREEYVDEEG